MFVTYLNGFLSHLLSCQLCVVFFFTVFSESSLSLCTRQTSQARKAVGSEDDAVPGGVLFVVPTFANSKCNIHSYLAKKTKKQSFNFISL